MRVVPYLIFPGTCREALDFYAEALEGSVEHLQTVAESPLPAPPEYSERIFNSVFAAGDLRFMASDDEPGRDLQIGHNVAMFLSCADPDSQRRVYEALADGGRTLFPLDGGFGMIEDRFAIRWMIALAPA